MALEKANTKLSLVERRGKMWQMIIVAIMATGLAMMIIDLYNAGRAKRVKAEDDWK